MLAILKKYALGYVLSKYSSEKNDASALSFLEYFIKLINIYTSLKVVNDYKEYIIVTIIYVLLLILTFIMSTEVSIKTARPLFNIILLIWLIFEIIFLQKLIETF